MSTEENDQLEAAFLGSPRQVITPMWVSASGISPEARTLAEPLIAGAMTVVGDDAPFLDRQMLAWWINLPRHDKGLQRYLAELQDIGFLVVFGGRHDKHGRRQARFDSATGRTIPDTYAVRMDPPEEYVGPRSLAEAREWFLSDRDTAYAQAPDDRRKDKITIKRVHTGHLSVSAGHHLPPKTGGRDSAPAPQNRGQEDVSAGHHLPPKTGGRDSAPAPQNRGQEDVSAGHHLPPKTGGSYEGEREGTPSREFPPSIDEKSATPPATARADDDALTRQVRDELVRRMPWRTKGHVLSLAEEPRVVEAIVTAIHDHGITLEQAQEHALHKLQRSDKSPVGYVVRGFAPDNLPAPVSANTLSLPFEASQPVPTANAGEESETSDWCGNCLPVRSSAGSPKCGSSCTTSSATSADSEQACALLAEQRAETQRRQARRLGNL